MVLFKKVFFFLPFKIDFFKSTLFFVKLQINRKQLIQCSWNNCIPKEKIKISGVREGECLKMGFSAVDINREPCSDHFGS